MIYNMEYSRSLMMCAVIVSIVLYVIKAVPMKLLVGHKACQKIFFDKLLPKYIKLLASAEKMNIVFAPEATEWEREYAD